MALEVITAGIILTALTFYILFGGADFGAGVWALFARGLRGPAQRKLIREAIGPIWEANHVWLILVVTVLFTGFPLAFAVMTTRLHIPLTLMLIGIVLRGAGLAFRSYGIQTHGEKPYWEGVFVVASLITPVLLGMTIGTLASGALGLHDRQFGAMFVWPWLAVFPAAVGVLALVLFAFLAAVYLTREARDEDLREDFRGRALVAAVLVAILAVSVFMLASHDAPLIWNRLIHSAWGRTLLLATAAAGVATVITLWTRRYALARICAAAEATLILWGWALAQFPFLVVPDITIVNAAAPALTLQLLILANLLGAVMLFPALYYLYRIFKERALFAPDDPS
jgi:cytochrome bd ubiquinol oxidase subunit II